VLVRFIVYKTVVKKKEKNVKHKIIYLNNFSDELPVQLMLPKAIQEAKNRQQLSSLALLGQGWWFFTSKYLFSSYSLLKCNTYLFFL